MTAIFPIRWFQRRADADICKSLRQELMILVHGRGDTAERLLDLERKRDPARSERWYLEKVIYDLRRK